MVNNLYLKSFTCFNDCSLDFCKGINVFIGRNGTGKTHILKCMAASMKANSLFALSTSKTKDKFGDLLTEKLLGYFKPDTLGHLVNKYGSGTASVNDEGKLEIVLENTGSVHQMLNSLAITVTGDNGAQYVLTEEELEPVTGQNLLTDSKLRTVIGVPEELAGCTAYTVAVSYDFSY